jgi:putative transposase
MPEDGSGRGYILQLEEEEYGGLGISELRRLKQLEVENRQLKKLVADLSLDKQMLQDVITKKL